MTGEKKQGLLGRMFGKTGAVTESGEPETESTSVELATGAENETGNSKDGLVELDNTRPSEAGNAPAGQTVTGDSKNDNGSEGQGESKSWFTRLKSGLKKSSHKLTDGITSIFTKSKLDDAALEDLEDLLIRSDLGVAMAMRITEQLAESRYDKDITADEVRAVLVDEVASILKPVARSLIVDETKRPFILLMVGVNGAGKTTTIGKMAAKFRDEGRSVMMVAGDTFRAAAIEQLMVWGERTGAEVISRPVGSDASGLVFEALETARQRDVDVLMIDTAGRLQNKTELMAELEKIVRVIRKFDESGPHEVILTLDATTGQNALNQVDIFSKTAGVSGLVMTKLDGSARGGILVAIADKFQMPVYAIGVGEGVEDMQPFNPDDFAAAIGGGDLSHEQA